MPSTILKVLPVSKGANKPKFGHNNPYSSVFSNFSKFYTSLWFLRHREKKGLSTLGMPFLVMVLIPTTFSMAPGFFLGHRLPL